MSTPPNRSDVDIERLLADLPLATAPSPFAGHIDDGELLTYRHGGLEAARVAAIDAHLAACRDCRDLLVGLAEPAPSLPIPLTSRRAARSRWLAAGGGLAAAAALAIAFLALPSSGPTSTAARAPEYAVRSARGGVAEVRGAEPADAKAPLVLEPESRLSVVLEPKQELTGAAPEVRAFASRAGGALVHLPADALTTGAGGAVKLEGRARALFGPELGRYTIHVAIGGTKDELAALEGLAPEAARGRAPHLSWVTVEVEAGGAR